MQQEERTDVIRSIVDIYGPILDDSRSEIDNKFSPCWFRCCLPFVVDVVSCVVLDYLLEKLRRRLCYAGDIITPLQEPSIWNIMLPIFN